MEVNKINNLIVIIGRISSGKSTLANEISEKFDIPIISFGKYLLEYSTKNDLPVSRIDLQNLGEKFIEEDSHSFLQNVLNSYGKIPNTIIVEGVRHLAIFEQLKIISINSFFIFIDTSSEIRHERYNNRVKSGDTQGITFDEFFSIDNHGVESNIDSLSSICDIIYSNASQKNELYKILGIRHIL